MNDNAVISEWRGECRHDTTSKQETPACDNKGRVKWTKDIRGRKSPALGYTITFLCHGCGAKFTGKVTTPKAYDTDPAAWDEALYQEIEKATIHQEFSQHLCMILSGCEECRDEEDICGGAAFQVYFAFIRATPAQKAAALAKAIREGK